MDDPTIVGLLWQRAESALEALSKRFGKRLMGIAVNILGVRQDAEESVNDTYLAVWNTVPPKKPDPLAGYVYATGRNISLDRLKYNTAGKRYSKYDLSLDELEKAIPGPALEETVEARELGLAINRFLAAQNEDNRALFLRRYWFGDSIREIADDFDLRENTVCVRLGRIRMRLREHLIKEGYVDE